MTPRLEPRIARRAEVDTQCRHCSGGGACLLSGHQLPNHESPSLTSSTGGEAIAPDRSIAGEKHVATHYRRSSSVWGAKVDAVSRLETRSIHQLMFYDTLHD